MAQTPTYPPSLFNRSAMVKQLFPRAARQRLRFLTNYPAIYYRLWANYGYDLQRFLRWSSVAGVASEQQALRAWIDADYHKIEKALALKSPRPGFGKVVIHRLTENLQRYLAQFGADRSTSIAMAVLDAYARFNRDHGVDTNDLERRLERLRNHCRGNGEGGVKQVRREEILAAARIDLEPFFFSRHSVRHFSDEPVEPELIERAVYLASKTPTVCNRQSLKVHAYFDADCQRVLSCQMGNSGFGDQVKVALVVTADSRTFFSVGERNQGWIDGGLFSMSLVYALHSLGLGSCCLNWSVEKEYDRKLKTVTDIQPWEMVIMMIGVGKLPEALHVAQSPRKTVDDLLVRGVTREATH